MKNVLLAAVFLLAPGFCMADNHNEAIVEMWKCEMKEGQKMEDVMANNEKWLAMTRKTTGSDEVQSYMMSPVVGTLTQFVFADAYPDMATWSKVKAAEETAEGEAIEAAFDALMDCTDNRLFKSKKTVLE